MRKPCLKLKMKMKKVDTSISSVASVYNTDSKVAVQSVMKLSDLALMVSWNTTVRLSVCCQNPSTA